MKRVPSPPDHLHGPAVAVWHRLHAFLAQRNRWEDVYYAPLAMTATVCARYVALAKIPGIDPQAVAQARLSARRMLAEMTFIQASRINVGVLNDDGLDADIAFLCAPL